jgi:hypothetical protein
MPSVAKALCLQTKVKEPGTLTLACFLNLNIKGMKKFIGLGRSLSKNEQKNIYGGYITDITLEEDQLFATCTVYCSCNSQCAVNAKCDKVTSCSATDEVGATCGSTYYSCATICSRGCN